MATQQDAPRAPDAGPDTLPAPLEMDPAAAGDLSERMVPSIRRLGPQLLVAGVLPVVGYILLRPHVSSDATALAAVMVFPVLEILYERRRHGSFDPIGLIALAGIAIGLAGAIIFHGDATLLKVRESMVTGAFGLVCLASLAAPRPAMFYLGRAFATAGDPDAMRDFDAIWELPGVPRRFRVVTAAWAGGLIGEAVARTALALTIPTERFLVLAPIINWGVLGALLWFTTAYRRAGQRRLEFELAEVPLAE